MALQAVVPFLILTSQVTENMVKILQLQHFSRATIAALDCITYRCRDMS